jgi:hypothetical protein
VFSQKGLDVVWTAGDYSYGLSPIVFCRENIGGGSWLPNSSRGLQKLHFWSFPM